MFAKLMSLVVVGFTLAACGTEPETAVAFYPAEVINESDFQPTQVAGYSIEATCRAADHESVSLSCFTKEAFLGTLTLQERSAEPAAVATPESLGDQFIELACRLCAEYQGRPSIACTACQQDDEPTRG